MNIIKKLINKYKELITYAFFGVCTTGVNFIAYELCNFIFGQEYYLVSNVIAWFVSVVFAYVTNKIWVFRSSDWSKKVLFKEIPSFFTARVFTLVVEEAGLFILVDLLKFNEYSMSIFSLEFSGETIAKVILAFVVVVLNYLFSKVFIFKKKNK